MPYRWNVFYGKFDLVGDSNPGGDVETLIVDDVDPLPTQILQQNPTEINAVDHKIKLNGSNGLVTYQLPNYSEDNVAQLGFIRATGQTVGAQTLDMISITIDENEAFTAHILVSGYADNDVGVGGYCTASAINVAGVLTLIDEADAIVQNPDLTDTNLIIAVDGTSLVVRVLGQVGRTINWNAIIPGISLVAKPA